MRTRWAQYERVTGTKWRVVCHFTTLRNAAAILDFWPPDENTASIRATQPRDGLGGGIHICTESLHGLGWGADGGRAFFETVGKRMWGEYWEQLQPGGPHHELLQCRKVSYLIVDLVPR